MRAFFLDHLLTIANWLALGVGITNRRGNKGSGLGGGTAAATSTKRNVILVMRAR